MRDWSRLTKPVEVIGLFKDIDQYGDHVCKEVSWVFLDDLLHGKYQLDDQQNSYQRPHKPKDH